MGKGKHKKKQKGDQSGTDREKTTCEMNTLEEYRNKGREICEKFCEFKDQYPIMLPPAPKQTYIDFYKDEEGASSSKFDDEKFKQANYEAEVLTYRALERLPEERCVVLHSFEYTHHQYRICDKSHDRRKCDQCKGMAAQKTECDFVVIGKNYVVIIEVKNVPIDEDSELTEEQRKKLTGALKGSLEQLEKTKSMINGLVEQVFAGMEADHQCSIICLSAFPNTSRDQFQNMDEQTKKQILCKEDFPDFSSWWKQHDVLGSISSIVQTEAFLAKHQEMKQVLVAIYCTDKNRCDELKCSLGKAIMDIDDELKKGNITFLSKNRLPNPNVMKATDIKSANIDDGINIFKDMLGIEYLTVEQRDAFNRDQNLLVINGPAGSGKTIILLAKIIKVIKSNVDNRAVLYIFSDDNISCKRYQDALDKAEISNEVIVNNMSMVYSREYTEQVVLESESRVVIVRISSLSRFTYNNSVTKLMYRNIHVFFDDWQGMRGPLARKMFTERDLLLTVGALTNCVIACDFTQAYSLELSSYRKRRKRFYSFLTNLPPERIVTLSLNLRNTSDITDILSKIREHIILQVLQEERDDTIPMIKQGHFIHGPQIVVHVIYKIINEKDFSVVTDILNEELDKLCNTDVIKIGIVYNTRRIIQKVIEERCSVDNNKIEWCNVKSCYSAEYPAVIVLYDVANYVDLSILYRQISRARVYCVVILYSSDDNHIFSGFEKLNDYMLAEFEDSIRVMRYD
ncbi:uncharacterized protein LOC134824910 [Bolinopsis microptera]|uniref:uncharacterized protein LOC134824910 n=1 Tax=Bolinopsis microptera TaxID=2820187 RepID=UPI00307A186A